MANSKPTILIIHGGYMFPDTWDAFRAHLKSIGHESICPRLPTVGDSSIPKSAAQTDDIAAVQTALKPLIASNKRIIVIAHSYGGVVACNALTQEFLAKDSSSPGVAHIVFLSAWVPQPGCTLEDVIKKYGFLCSVDIGMTEDGAAYAKNAAESFFNDINEVDPMRAKALADATTTHNWSSNALPVTEAPYLSVPSTYVLLEKDVAIQMPLQKGMLGDMVEAGANVKTLSLKTGHCPFLSKVEEFSEVVKAIKV